MTCAVPAYSKNTADLDVLGSLCRVQIAQDVSRAWKTRESKERDCGDLDLSLRKQFTLALAKSSSEHLTSLCSDHMFC